MLVALLFCALAAGFDEWYTGYDGSWPPAHTYQNFNPVTGSFLHKCPKSQFQKGSFEMTPVDWRLFDALNSDTSVTDYR